LTQTLNAIRVQPPIHRRMCRGTDWFEGKERKDQAKREYETKSLTDQTDRDKID
jgi:hypothetical protein